MADSEIREAVTVFLDALNDRDDSFIDRMVDVPRELEEMRSLGVLTGFSQAQYSRFVEQWKHGYGADLCKDPHLHLRKVQIRRIEVLTDENEVRVYTHAWNDATECMSRWWLRRTDSGWKMYDHQHLHDDYLRHSRTYAFVVGSLSGSTPEWCFNKNTFRRLQATVPPDESILEMIALLQQSHFPPEYESVILTCKGMYFLKADPARSIRYFDEAITKYPDNPIVYSLRASAFIMAKRYQDALESMTQYIDIVGDSALDCAELGIIYEGLHRQTDATDAYRRGLACDPSSKENRERLARALKKLVPAPSPAGPFDLLR
ncbi:MAG: hsp70-Hsp90 organizing protein 3-like [Phycisphaerales bacterium]|nr:hsp70-Hsp90 organizing protein 3-like [Phycisphaerales bacterium]